MSLIQTDNKVHEPDTIVDDNLQKHSNTLVFASYSMSLPQKRILMAALKAVDKTKKQSLDVTLKYTDIIKCYNFSDSNANYKVLRDSIESLASCVVNTRTADEMGYIPWFSGIWLAVDNSYVRIQFNAALASYIAGKTFTLIDLKSIGRLGSCYAIRIYELVLSQSNRAGQENNKPGEWFYYCTIEDLKLMFALGHSYVAKKGKNAGKFNFSNFRVKTIDNPCEEINNSNLGLTIKPQYVYHGKTAYAIKFCCKFSKNCQTPLPLTDDPIKSAVLTDIVNSWLSDK